MVAQILSGKTLAQKYLDVIKLQYARLAALNPALRPRLDIIKANDREDTAIYVRRKLCAIKHVGFHAQLHEFKHGHLADLQRCISQLNSDPSCHGILLQSPVELSAEKRNMASSLHILLDPRKDVDGLHPSNLGRLLEKTSEPLFYPCTPLGIMMLLKYYNFEAIAGKRVVVIGRSEIVGMPVALMCTRADATVTVCHSRTKDLPELVAQADLLIAAVGRAQFVQSSWIKSGAVVVDVGINRMLGWDGSRRLVGDVNFEGALGVASAVTPVPGGVGPMTVAMLVRNLFHSALRASQMADEIDTRWTF